MQDVSVTSHFEISVGGLKKQLLLNLKSILAK